MILRSLDLEAFGRFSKRSFEFRRGLNLVVGPNEAGKSTMMEAVPAILFGVRDKSRYQPWGKSGSCRASLQFETGDGSVQVERDLLSDEVRLACTDQLYQPSSQLEGKASPQGRSGEKKAYLQELERLLGYRDADLFRATLFFGQGDLDLQFGKKLTERIKTLLSGSSEVDYDQVLSDLYEHLYEVTAENPWGKDKTRQRALELAETELLQVEERLNATSRQVEELRRLEDEIRSVEELLRSESEQLKQGERYLQWVNTYWQLESQKQSLSAQFEALRDEESQRLELQAREDSILGRLAESGLSCPVAEKGLDVRQAIQDVRRTLLQLQRLQVEERQLRQRLLKLPIGSHRLAWCWTALTCALGGGLAWYARPWALQVSLITTLALTPAWLFSIWKVGRLTAQRSEMRGKGQLLEQQRLELESRLESHQELLTELKVTCSEDALDELANRFALHAEAFEEVRDVRSALSVLRAAGDIEESTQGVVRELAIVDERLKKGRRLKSGVDLQANDLEDAETKLQNLRNDIEQLEEKRNRLWQKRAEASGEIASRGQLEDQRGELVAEVNRLQRRKRVLTLACDVLRSAVREFGKNYLKRFAGRASHYLKSTTDERYRELRLLEDLQIELKGRQGHWKPLEHFSQGTRDAVALAVRLALVDQFSHGRKLPLLLDDALVNLDVKRQSKVLRLLKRVSADHQVILFSHDERLARKAARERWHVLTLEDSSPQEGVGEEEPHAGQLHLL